MGILTDNMEHSKQEEVYSTWFCPGLKSNISGDRHKCSKPSKQI